MNTLVFVEYFASVFNDEPLHRYWINATFDVDRLANRSHPKLSNALDVNPDFISSVASPLRA